MSHDNGFGRRCPRCDEPLVDPRSLGLRQCATGCKSEWAWPLSAGQKPLIGSNRTDRKESTQ